MGIYIRKKIIVRNKKISDEHNRNLALFKKLIKQDPFYNSDKYKGVYEIEPDEWEEKIVYGEVYGFIPLNGDESKFVILPRTRERLNLPFGNSDFNITDDDIEMVKKAYSR